MATDGPQQLTFWERDRQQVTVAFDGGRVVTDAGVFSLHLLDKQLGVLSTIAQRLPDPRTQKRVTHTCEALLTQEVYQILAGYPDGNDAQQLRNDPLFQTLVDVPPDAEQPLASGSTLNRFHHAYTRRQAELSLERGDGRGIYHGFYVQRGAVPEKPIGELKNGLRMDRLSFHRFRANGLKLLEHTLAYALVVLHREAVAAVAEVVHAEVGTLRQRLWKVGAVVKTSVRRIWFHLSETWPHRHLFVQVYQAVCSFVAKLHGEPSVVLPGANLLPLQ